MLRIGTCSWKYDSWKGLVYSEGVKNFLEEYSRKYKTVEVDQWFWSLHGKDKITLPREKDVKEYAASVPEDFKFSVKIPNSITLTHFYSRGGAPLVENPHFLSPDLMQSFLDSLKPMYPNLGPLMFQFEYLNKQKMASQGELHSRLEVFFEMLPDGFEYALELRNPNYLNKAFFTLLKKHNITPVLIHGYYLPPVFETIKKFDTTGNGKLILRLHGPDREGIEELSKNQWNRLLLPKDEDLQRVIDTVKVLLSQEVDIYLNVNNHYEGSAPMTIERIEGMLAER